MGRKGEDLMRSEFKVVIDGVKLSQAQTQQLNQAVQRALVREMADISFNGKPDLAIRINPEWLGIWVKKLDKRAMGDFETHR